MQLKKICHLTSVHPRNDTRIFIKECHSLAKQKQYEVCLIVTDGKGDTYINNIHIYDIGRSKGRINRVLFTTRKVLKKAIDLNCDIYHFHDPELIPIGIKLKKLGKKVIFDIHENIALQISDKTYIVKPLRKIFSIIYRRYEKFALRKFDYLVLAEESYMKYYQELSKNIIVVLNMPDMRPFEKFSNQNRNKNELFYIGDISIERGLDITIEAISQLKEKYPEIMMHYIGSYEPSLIKSLNLNHINDNIKFYGRLSLFDGLEYSRSAKVGLSVLKPIQNYIKSYSTKIFEYMALGLPVITSNFPLYKDVVEKYHCGICIDPLNVKELVEAIEYIFSNPDEARLMGENGKNLISEKFNWSIEEAKLLGMYVELNDE